MLNGHVADLSLVKIYRSYNLILGCIRHPCDINLSQVLWRALTIVCVWRSLRSLCWTFNEQSWTVRGEARRCEDHSPREPSSPHAEAGRSCYRVGTESLRQLRYSISFSILGWRNMLRYHPLVFWKSLSTEHAEVLIKCNWSIYSKGQARVLVQDPSRIDQMRSSKQ